MFNLWYIFASYLRSFIKWFLHKTTGLCELQRICYGEISGAPRTLAIEKSLNLSKLVLIKRLIAHLNEVSDNQRFTGTNEQEIIKSTVGTILLVKKINPKLHPQFPKSFGKCIQQIWGYRQLIAEVESLRTIKFDSNDEDHEKKLLQLWENLVPAQKLESRVSKQWQFIGFQGDDPKTDFRGMGLLGLENLLFFSTEYPAPARHVLSHSQHPSYGYCFAIVGINLTSMAVQMLRNGEAKPYFFNNPFSKPTMRLFHQFYSYLFYEFDRYWLECKPTDIMQFASIKLKFEDNIRVRLTNPNDVFKMNFSVDNV